MKQHLSSCDVLVVSDIAQHYEYVRERAGAAFLQALDELLLLIDDALQIGGVELLEEALFLVLLQHVLREIFHGLPHWVHVDGRRPQVDVHEHATAASRAHEVDGKTLYEHGRA